jgi:hypothetical protein
MDEQQSMNGYPAKQMGAELIGKRSKDRARPALAGGEAVGPTADRGGGLTPNGCVEQAGDARYFGEPSYEEDPEPLGVRGKSELHQESMRSQADDSGRR